MQFDIFCRVIDNLGDIGVCWRLSRRLAEFGDFVRLWVDDATALRFMVDSLENHPHITVLPWVNSFSEKAPGDLVIEAFGCHPPENFIAAMAAKPIPPVWLNLEYLTAESMAQRNHGLLSPQQNGLKKWFFYPGFSRLTGGLLQENDLRTRKDRFDSNAWLQAQGIQRHHDGERIVSLFCYQNPRLDDWLNALALQAHQQITHILLTPGPATTQARLLSLPKNSRLKFYELPWVTQEKFDEMLWASDVNFVRGEDSIVRALWAGKPLVWQIYPQDDGAHIPKLNAFLDWYVQEAPHELTTSLRAAFLAWNGWHGAGDADAYADAADLQNLHSPLDFFSEARMRQMQQHAQQVQTRAYGLPELGSALKQFVESHKARDF